MLFEIYVDESCKQNHKIMVIGGHIVKANDVSICLAKLRASREQHNTWGEVKWEKVSKGKFEFYKSFANACFELIEADLLNFHCLYVETNQFKHKGGEEETYNRLMYQLLLHKFGAKYGKNNKFHVYIDSDFTRQDPEIMKPMLNADLKKKYDIDSEPFRRLQYVRSHDTDLVQATDLIVGAIGSRKNNRHKEPGAAKHKIDLGQHIAEKASPVEKAKLFSLWNFIYKLSSQAPRLMRPR